MRRTLLIAAFLLIGAGCGSEHAAPHAEDHASMAAAVVAITDPARFSVEGAASLEAGKVGRVFLNIRSADGNGYAPGDLKIVHDKKFHLLAVRDDMTGFMHLHPDYVASAGKWSVALTPESAGTYHFYADIAPSAGEPVVLLQTFEIGGPTVDGHPPIADEPLFGMVGAHRAELHLHHAPTAGATAHLSYAVTADGLPATDIRPYLGAYGHVVILKHGSSETFVHVHPASSAAPSGGKVEFSTVFPSPGRYTLYAQFDLGGEIKTYPFTVDVE